MFFRVEERLKTGQRQFAIASHGDIVSESARMYKNSGLSAYFRCDCPAKKCYTQSGNVDQSGGKKDMASVELIENLEEIAKIKESLPSRSRGWCSELGLHVRISEAGGMARLQAGGKFRSRIDLWRESPNDLWQVKKYKLGDWEALVKPTLELAKWLEVRGGIAVTAKRKFRDAIKSFRKSGHLILPEGLDSIPESSELGRILGTYPGSITDWDDDVLEHIAAELQSYVLNNPVHVTAWYALSRVYRYQCQCKDALEAIDLAVTLAPEQAEFQLEAASLYLAAIQNEVAPEAFLSRMRMLDPSFINCTLEILGCSYEEAQVACKRHFEAILKSSSPQVGDFKKVARYALQEWGTELERDDYNTI